MQYKGRATARYLKKRYCMPSGRGRYNGLNESTIRGWMMPDGRNFKPKVQEAIRAVECGMLSDNVMHMGAKGMWEGRKELLAEFVLLLNSLRNADVGLNSFLIQMQLRAFVQVKCPEVLLEFGGKHEISRPYVRYFVRTKMGWSFRCTTTNASKLPTNWQAQGDAVTHRIAYLVHAYRIPECLVVNGDQTGMRVMPVGAERTYTLQGARDVTVAGKNDKRQVTLLMACSAEGDLLPVQMIFKGKKPVVLPRGQASKQLRDAGWHLTMTYNHWSQLESMQEWIELLYLPYVAQKCEERGLDVRVQKSVLLLDCYSVHKSLAFRDWLKKTYPLICLLFIPGGCTSKLQPCDVVLQRPFKCAVHQNFMKFAVNTMAGQMNRGVNVENARLEIGIAALRNHLCGWLLSAWTQIAEKKAMIASGWKKCGFLQAWDKGVQERSLELNDEGLLFKADPLHEVKEEFCFIEDNHWYGERNLLDLLNFGSAHHGRGLDRGGR
ncbi:unnamed protein product [Calypogeia fissa]